MGAKSDELFPLSPNHSGWMFCHKECCLNFWNGNIQFRSVSFSQLRTESKSISSVHYGFPFVSHSSPCRGETHFLSLWRKERRKKQNKYEKSVRTDNTLVSCDLQKTEDSNSSVTHDGGIHGFPWLGSVSPRPEFPRRLWTLCFLWKYIAYT